MKIFLLCQQMKMQFMAPEILQGKTDYNEKVEVYSFGVVLYFIVSQGEYPKFNLADIVTGKSVSIPKTFRKLAQELLRRCLSPSPSDRPSFKKLYDALQKNKTKLI